MKKKEETEEVLSIQEELDKARPYTEMYEKAYNFNTERFDAYAELMAFYQGNQHLLKKYKNETPWVVNMNTPYATVAIDNRVSSLLAKDSILLIIATNSLSFSKLAIYFLLYRVLYIFYSVS